MGNLRGVSAFLQSPHPKDGPTFPPATQSSDRQPEKRPVDIRGSRKEAINLIPSGSAFTPLLADLHLGHIRHHVRSLRPFGGVNGRSRT